MVVIFNYTIIVYTTPRENVLLPTKNQCDFLCMLKQHSGSSHLRLESFAICGINNINACNIGSYCCSISICLVERPRQPVAISLQGASKDPACFLV